MEAFVRSFTLCVKLRLLLVNNHKTELSIVSTCWSFVFFASLKRFYLDFAFQRQCESVWNVFKNFCLCFHFQRFFNVFQKLIAAHQNVSVCQWKQQKQWPHWLKDSSLCFSHFLNVFQTSRLTKCLWAGKWLLCVSLNCCRSITRLSCRYSPPRPAAPFYCNSYSVNARHAQDNYRSHSKKAPLLK